MQGGGGWHLIYMLVCEKWIEGADIRRRDKRKSMGERGHMDGIDG